MTAHLYDYVAFFSKIEIPFLVIKAKNNYAELSVKLNLLQLPQMVKTGPELTWLPQNYKPRHSLICLVNYNGNKIYQSEGFSTRTPLKLREMEVKSDVTFVPSSIDKNHLREILQFK